MRARGEQPDRDAAPDVRRLRLAPADPLGRLLDVADEVGVERLAAVPDLLAGQAEVLAAHLERVEPGEARELVDLLLADPLQVRRAEGAIRARRSRVRVDAVGHDAERLPAVRAGRRVAARRRHARAVVGVGAGVEPALDLAAEQAALGVHRRSHPAAHPVAAGRRHRLVDPVLDPHRPARPCGRARP